MSSFPTVSPEAVNRLVLIRHGETAWNAERRFQGQADPPLDPLGVEQAAATAVAVAALRPFLVLCSDLQRARATAEPLVAATGARLVVDPALRELELGGWEGLTHAEVEDRHPDEYRDWRAGLPVRRGGGETEAEAGARAAAFIAGQLAAAVPPSGAAPSSGAASSEVAPAGIVPAAASPSGGVSSGVVPVGVVPAAVSPSGGGSPGDRVEPTVAVVAHGIVLRAAMAALDASGVITVDGAPPHLGNGEWLVFKVHPA